MTTLQRIISIIGCGLFCATTANAEYYIVGPITTYECWSPCCTCAATVETEKRLYHDRWYSRHKANHYSIEEITTTCAPVIYDQPRENKHSFVKFNHAGESHRGHYVNTANDPYDPDMTTADDDVMVDSDMNNQY